MRIVDGASRGLLAVGAGGLAAALIGFAPSEALRLDWFARYGAAIVAANVAVVVALALAVAWPKLRDPRAWIDDVFWAAFLCAVVGVLCVAVPARMRILADEYLLAGAAQGLWLGGPPAVPTGGWYVAAGVFDPLPAVSDKHGIALPVLWSLVDAAGAFTLSHGYAINAALGAIALVALYALLRAALPRAAAAAGPLLLAAQPVFAWTIRSAALESLNLALLAVLAAIAIFAWRRPTALAALLLAAIGPLAAQARYESVLVGATGFVLAAVLLTRASARAPAWIALALMPLLYLPFAWQRALPFAHELAAAGADHAWGFDHFLRHLTRAWRALALPGPSNPTGPLLVLLAAGGLVSAATRPPNRGLLAVAVSVVSATALVLAYVWGDFGSAITARYALPMLALASIAGAFGLASALARIGADPTWGLAGAGVALACALPAIVADANYAQLAAGPAANRVLDWERAAYPGCRFVYATTMAPYFVVHGRSAVPIDHAISNWSRVRERAARARIDAVVMPMVLQRGMPEPREAAALRAGFESRTLYESGIGTNTTLRVVSIDRRDLPLATEAAARCRIGPVR